MEELRPRVMMRPLVERHTLLTTTVTAFPMLVVPPPLVVEALPLLVLVELEEVSCQRPSHSTHNKQHSMHYCS